MDPLPQTATHDATGAPPPPPPPAAPAPAAPASPSAPERPRRASARRLAPHHIALAGVLALSAVLNINHLSQNGYANIFYSAAVKSMLRSLHNFVFVSADPGGLITVDKPPLALWLQAISAKLFGFAPLSLLLPEAIAGVLAVWLLYRALTPRLGVAAGLAGALAMAVFPSFVAVSRDNGVDPLLILLMVLAASAALRATETGRWRTLIWSGVLVGLAFNTKTLAAWLIVPPIALAYLVCAPGTLARRMLQLIVAGLVMLLVSFSWIAFVDATPASQRPYVGSSTNNSEVGLTFEYNGFGRVEGQEGGPGQVKVLPGATVPLPSPPHPASKPAATAKAKASTTEPSVDNPGPLLPDGRYANPFPFGGPPGPLRLFGVGLGDQAGWLLPLALFGLIALALLVFAERRTPPAREPGAGTGTGTASAQPRGRRDPRLACLLIFGGWFLVEALVLSASKGIVHPYYVSALAPGTGAMIGAGTLAIVTLARGEDRRRWAAIVLSACALAGTVAAEVVLLQRERYLLWLVPVLIIGAAAGFCALLLQRRLAAPAIAFLFALLLVAPTAYASTAWLAPVEGTFPAAGPKQTNGPGGYGVSKRDLGIDLALLHYVAGHDPGRRWALLTVGADTAAPFTLNGLNAGALGGYSGADPAVDGPRLARMVANREARYVLLGGEFSERGGNAATKAVLRACRQLPASTWKSPVPYPFGLVLFDCAGRERALAG